MDPMVEEDDDCNYFWVEDAYFEADDLAEHAIPSPVPYDGHDSWDELDRFEYFVDIEYDTDGYHDTPSPQQGHGKTKAKRKALGTGRNAHKRRKSREGDTLDSSEDELGPRIPPICWVSQRERLALPDVPRFTDGAASAFALLKDHRERFKHVVGFKIQLPSDVLDDDVTPALDRSGHEVTVTEDHPDDEIISDDDAEELETEDIAIDPESLKAALSENLSRMNMGANDEDRGMLLQLATRMLKGEASSDQLAGELTTALLGDGATQPGAEGGATGLSEWAKQRIDTKAMEGSGEEGRDGSDSEDAEPSTAAVAPPTRSTAAPRTRKRKAVDEEPPDFAGHEDARTPAKKRTRTYDSAAAPKTPRGKRVGKA